MRSSIVTFLFSLGCAAFAQSASLVTDPIDAGQEKFVGSLVRPTTCDQKCPGLVLWSGSGGGLPVDLARYFAERGYAALAINYFTLNPADAQSYLPYLNANVPLEVFERAIEWMRSRGYAHDGKVAILGGSRGGEAALLVGQHFGDRINAVVAHRPSSHAWSSRLTGMGIPADKIGPETSSWTYGGQEIPYISFEAQRGKFRFCPHDPALNLKVSSHSLTDGVSGCLRRPATTANPFDTIVLSFVNGFNFLLDHTNAKDLEAARIKVENIVAPIFASGGTDDQMWPTGRMIDTIVQHRNNRNSDQFVVVKGAGHLNNIPGTPGMVESAPSNLSYLRRLDSTGKAVDDGLRTVMVFGGTKTINESADQIIMDETVKFLDKFAR